jgi:peptide/nickel transport system permease protein
MFLFVGPRLLALVGLVILISFGVFALLYAAPGSVEQTLLGTRPSTPQTVAAIRLEYHLNDSFLQQYWIWLRNAAQFNFGTSVRTDQPVSSAITQAMGLTLFLSAYAFIIAMFFGVGLGIMSAVWRRSPIDRGAVAISVIGVSAPAFVTGIFLLYIFAVDLNWLPAYGDGNGFSGRLSHLLLPAVALALTVMALIVKFTRAGMITALEQDYVAFARARGVPYRRVLIHYALRNALVPIVTGAGLILGVMLAGAVLVEVTFALPGVGTLLVNSVLTKDVPMVQGIAVVIAVAIVVVNLITDIVYLFVDPRIRYGRGLS